MGKKRKVLKRRNEIEGRRVGSERALSVEMSECVGEEGEEGERLRPRRKDSPLETARKP